jgi:lysophospholipase L1-like esterase
MKKIFTLSFVSVVIVLIFLELVIRLFFSENMSGRFEYGYHPTAGFVERKDGVVELVRAGGRRFRPQSFQMPKVEGVFRVFVIGDSVPRGPSLEGAYAWQLQELLKQEGIKAEVLNMGVAGYGVRRNQIILKQVLQYQPDLIILHLNDSNEYEDEREWRRAVDFKSWHPSKWLTKSLLIARIYELKTEKIFWESLPQKIRETAGVKDADAELAKETDNTQTDNWWKLMEDTTLENCKFMESMHCPFILVSQARKDKSKQLDDAGLDLFARSLVGEPDRFLSMRQLFSDEVGLTLFSDSSHLRAAGHERLAKALLKKIYTISTIN